MGSVIEVEGLRKAYGDTVAVDGVSFQVDAGEIFGVVGPNGAGKTTLVESVIGLRRPDSGRVSVLGLDPHRQGRFVRQRIGVQLQQAALPERIRVREALDLYASFYHQSADRNALLEQWGLGDKRDSYYMALSGGQQQRLFIALALVNNPDVVFLDELTRGLDPQARRATWDLVRAVRDRGTTVVLVTHFMDEAERLCDRVAIVDRGRLVALDTPYRLIQSVQQEARVAFSVDEDYDSAWLREVPGVEAVEHRGESVAVSGSGPLMARVAAALADRGLTPEDLRTERATLEDVFLTLTGRTLRD